MRTSRSLFRVQAFTLIELVIVIVLLGILSAVALPRFLNLSTDAKRASNQQVASSLNAAHAQFALKARLPKNSLSPNDGSDPYIPSIALATVDVDPSLPSGASILLFFAKPSYTLMGATLTAFRYPDGHLRMDASLHSGTSQQTLGDNSNHITIICADIFQALSGPSTTVENVYTTKPVDYRALNLTALPGNILSPTGVPASTFTVTAATSTTDLGSCLYVLKSSISEKIVFYIHYNATTGIFSAIEADS